MASTYPLRLVTLSSGTRHFGTERFGAFFVRCRDFSVTPSWIRGQRGATGIVVGRDPVDAPVTCRRCLKLSGGEAGE